MSIPAKDGIILEVCVDSVESALAAQDGGAARVELCSNLAVEGTTPSSGLIAIARKSLHIGLHVMIRPRGGDFCYSEQEFEAMKHDIQRAKQLGADGVVIGILRLDRRIDVERTRTLLGLARPLSFTFHRAIDVSADAHQALQDLIGLGVDRVLTSGCAPTALEGLPTLQLLIKSAEGRIIVMPAGDINRHNIRTIIKGSGAKEIHVGDGIIENVDYPHAGMFNAIRSVVRAEKVRDLSETVEG